MKEKIGEVDNDIIQTFNHEKRCFNTAVTRCVYDLLDNHVAITKVSSCITSVISNLTGKTCERLPSKSTVENMNIQRVWVAQQQLATELPTKSDTTLYSDETSKYGEKVMGYHLSDNDKRYYTLGLRDIATKSANDTLSTFKELLHDLDDVQEETDAGKKIFKLQSSTGCQCLPVSLASIRITCPFGLDTCVSTYNCVMQFGNRGLTFCVT